MSWEFCRVLTPVAKKEHKCQAAAAIFRSDMGVDDFSEEEWGIIEYARNEKFKILPGTEYIHASGIWEGGWCTFKARRDMDAICMKYNLYEE